MPIMKSSPFYWKTKNPGFLYNISPLHVKRKEEKLGFFSLEVEIMGLSNSQCL